MLRTCLLLDLKCMCMHDKTLWIRCYYRNRSNKLLKHLYYKSIIWIKGLLLLPILSSIIQALGYNVFSFNTQTSTVFP